MLVTPPDQRERSSDRRHRQIREAAIGIFLARGYEGTTMEEIAVRAGVSKQTVYKHFTDKQHLFADIVLSTTDDMDALVALIADRLTDTSDLAKDLEHLAKTFLVALMQPRVLRLRRLVISSADRFPEIATAWYERGFERAPQPWRGASEPWPNDGCSPSTTPPRPPSISSACCSGSRSTRPCSPAMTTTPPLMTSPPARAQPPGHS